MSLDVLLIKHFKWHIINIALKQKGPLKGVLLPLNLPENRKQIK